MKHLYLLLLLVVPFLISAQQQSLPGSAAALSFASTSSEVVVKDHSSLNPTKSITVEAWIYPTSFATNSWENTIFCKHNWDRGNKGYVLRVGDGGKISFNLSFGGTWYEVVTRQLLSTYEWAHVAGVYNGDSIMVYLNGELVGTRTQTGNIDVSSGAQAKVGALSTGKGRNFSGIIDELKVWNTDLSDTLIQDYMCQKIGNSHPKKNNLALYYKMDDGTGSTVTDYGLAGSNGAINNCSWVLSGAPIGDASIHALRNSRLGMASSLGDSVYVNRVGGSPDNLYLYYIADTTWGNPSSGISADFDSSHYWGVWAVGGTSPTFNIQYHYGNYNLVTSSNECDIDFFTKSGNNDSTWDVFSANANLAGDSISRSGTKPGEFILGFYGINKAIGTNTGDSTACVDDNLTLLAPGNSTFKYQWYRNGSAITNATKSTYIAKVSGKYKVYVERDKNCNYTTKELNVTINSSPSIIFPQPSAICENINQLWLTGARPLGGTFIGKGLVKDSLFSPSSVLAGSYNIRYEYKDKKGCVGRDTITVVVNALPNVRIKSTQGMCDNLDSVVLTEGLPAGGTYFGTGIYRNQFFPDSLPKSSGIFPISYTYTDTNGCMDTAKNNVKVLGATTLSVPAPDTICANADKLRLRVTPFGGKYSGNGVSGNFFDPAVTGTGTFYARYEFYNIDNCLSADSQKITVVGLPTASVAANDSVCINADSVALSSGMPAGGDYMGNGISNGYFHPTMAGNETYTYVYVDGNGCSDTATGIMKTLDTAFLMLGRLSGVCPNEIPYTLSAVSPNGGIYTGNGVSNNVFDPAAAGSGIHNIVYNYTNSSGCSSTLQYTQQVFNLGKATLDLGNDLCENASAVSITNFSPSGGALSGLGISGSDFDPALAGSGTHTITYTANDSNRCEIEVTDNITVNATPSISWVVSSSECAYDTLLSIETATPTGGNYKAGGSSSSNYNPSLFVGAGKVDVSYGYTDANGCSALEERTIVINALPAKPSIQADDTKLTSSATTGNQWYSVNGAISGANSQTYVPGKKGRFYVEVTNDSGCVSKSDWVQFENLSTGNRTNSFLEVFPNPTSNVFTISGLGHFENATITVSTLDGRIVETITTEHDQLLIDATSWNNGVYLISVQSINALEQYKIVKH
ncbi:MAG: T9SS type A sorting domain-containing protein [Bacteroidetes bacterium]|nr:T9SS type A sorting domain-containing protein [Bacteroidota bacterium]